MNSQEISVTSGNENNPSFRGNIFPRNNEDKLMPGAVMRWVFSYWTVNPDGCYNSFSSSLLFRGYSTKLEMAET